MIRFTMGKKVGYFVALLLFVIVIVLSVRYIINVRIPNEGILKIQSSPPSSVFLDNVHKGRTPFEGKVSSGEYTIKLVADSPTEDYVPWQGKVVVSKNLLTYVNRDLSSSEITSAGEVLWLEQISSDKSEMSVLSTPDGATVIIDNETKGITPLTLGQIEPGDHTLIVSSPGFISRTLKLRTTVGYKLNVSVQLALSPGREGQSERWKSP